MCFYWICFVPWVTAYVRWLPRMLRLHVRFPLRLHWFILWTRRSVGTAHEGVGCDQSIGSTVSDAIVRSWLWLTATRSSPVGCMSTLLQVVDNWTTFCGSRFSTGRLLAIEDFTFTFTFWLSRWIFQKRIHIFYSKCAWEIIYTE